MSEIEITRTNSSTEAKLSKFHLLFQLVSIETRAITGVIWMSNGDGVSFWNISSGFRFMRFVPLTFYYSALFQMVLKAR